MDEDDLKLVVDALNLLSEHFDTVQIFATRYEGGDDGGTAHISKGTGNWFARRGQIQTWLEKERESSRIEMRKDSEDDEGE